MFEDKAGAFPSGAPKLACLLLTDTSRVVPWNGIFLFSYNIDGTTEKVHKFWTPGACIKKLITAIIYGCKKFDNIVVIRLDLRLSYSSVVAIVTLVQD